MGNHFASFTLAGALIVAGVPQVHAGSIIGEMAAVAEGVETTRAAFELARRVEVEMPIVEQMYAILYEGRAPAEALRSLMTRDPKPEEWS